MDDLDLDAIEARAHEFCSVCDGSGTVSCWSPGGPCPEGQTVCETCGPCRQSDVPALVAALREARAEAKAAWEQAERDLAEANDLADERDDWRRRRPRGGVVTPQSEVTDVLAVIDRLGPALLVRRTMLGLSLREVARQTGESASTVMRVEKGDDCNLSTARNLLAWIGSATVARVEGDES